MPLRQKIKEKVSDFLESIRDDTSDGIPMTPSVGYIYMPNPMMNQPTLYNYSVAPCRYIVEEEYMPTMKETTSYSYIVEEEYVYDMEGMIPHNVPTMACGPSSSIRIMPMVEFDAPAYKIFLSFRGKDTRHNFTRNLYDALMKQNGFEVFMDDQKLKRGDLISEGIMEAIKLSKLSIIVLSENFANSTWCLNELVEILERKRKRNQRVWPIFYKVDPADVRYQKNSYETAMVKQERRFGKDSEKVKKWRSTLTKVCGLRGFHYMENSGYECDFIKVIIKEAKNIRDQLDGYVD